MHPKENQSRVAAELLRIEDPQERLAYVMDRAKRSPRIPELHRTEGRLIRGCTTRVWLQSESTEAGACTFRTDSESAMVRGLACLIAEVYSDCTAVDIVSFNCTVLSEARLEHIITPTRLHGLAQLQKAIQTFARQQTPHSSPSNPANLTPSTEAG